MLNRTLVDAREAKQRFETDQLQYIQDVLGSTADSVCRACIYLCTSALRHFRMNSMRNVSCCVLNGRVVDVASLDLNIEKLHT